MHNQEYVLGSKSNQPEPSPKNGKIRVKLITPLFESFIVEADSVLLPAIDGDMLILPDRAPIFLSLRPGRMVVYNKDQEPIKFLISSGVCEVRRNLCPVLAWGGREDKINPERIKRQLDIAIKSLPSTHELAKSEALSRIEFFKMVLKELNYDLDKNTLENINKKEIFRMQEEDLGIEK